MNNSIGNNLSFSSLQQTAAIQKTAVETNTAPSNKSVASENSQGSSDQASLSHASTSLAQALTTSDVRTDKVAQLQQTIASGNYHVSSSDVADKMLHSLLE